MLSKTFDFLLTSEGITEPSARQSVSEQRLRTARRTLDPDAGCLDGA
jgi:hypothetical protein